MEDFAVDLDKVLDDFELSEGVQEPELQSGPMQSINFGLEPSPLTKPSLHRHSPDQDIYQLPLHPASALDLSQADFRPALSKPDPLPAAVPIELTIGLEVRQNGHLGSSELEQSRSSSPDSVDNGGHQRLVEAQIESPAHLQHSSTHRGDSPNLQDTAPLLIDSLNPACTDATSHLGPTAPQMSPSMSPADKSVKLADVPPLAAISSSQALPAHLFQVPGGLHYPESQSDSGVSVSTSEHSETPSLQAAADLSTPAPNERSPTLTPAHSPQSHISVTQGNMPSVSEGQTTEMNGLPDMMTDSHKQLSSEEIEEPAPSPEDMSPVLDTPSEVSIEISISDPQATPNSESLPALDSISNQTVEGSPQHGTQTSKQAADAPAPSFPHISDNGMSPDSIGDTVLQATVQPVGFGEDEVSMSDAEMSDYLAGCKLPEKELSGSLQTSAGQVEAAYSAMNVEAADGWSDRKPASLVVELEQSGAQATTPQMYDFVPELPGAATPSSNRPGFMQLPSPSSPAYCTISPSPCDSTPSERPSSAGSLERFLAPSLTNPSIATPMEDLGFAKVPGYVPSSSMMPVAEGIAECMEEEEEEEAEMEASAQQDDSLVILEDTQPVHPAEKQLPEIPQAADVTVLPGPETLSVGECTEVQEAGQLESGQEREQSAEAFDSVDSAASLPVSVSGFPGPLLDNSKPESQPTTIHAIPAGMGARPKDPSVLRRNRPNSLIGLSTPDLPLEVPPTGVYPVEGDSLVHPNQLTPLSVPPAPKSFPAERKAGLSLPLPLVDAAPSLPQADMGCSQSEPQFPKDSTDELTEMPEIPGLTSPNLPPPQTQLAPPAPTTPTDGPAKQKRPNSLNLSLPADPRVDGTAGSTPYMLSSDDSTPLGMVGNPLLGLVSPPGSGAAAPMGAANMRLAVTQLGKVAPHWLPDSEAANCMQCEARFTFTKRRHHCRACGKVFCSACCSLRCRLDYMGKEARVCSKCYQDIVRAQAYERTHPSGAGGGAQDASPHSPNPNNPDEYCSTIPPLQQAQAALQAAPPTVMVPVGVLRKQGSRRNSEPKQVMFSDGIRPGGDLTELDGNTESRLPVRKPQRTAKKVEQSAMLPQVQPTAEPEAPAAKKRTLTAMETASTKCLIPESGLPPVIVSVGSKADFTLEETTNPEKVMAKIKDMEDPNPVMFSINKNLFVLVKMVNLDCCVNRLCWCFTTRGMCTVGQDEVVIILECLPDEELVPRDIFCHLNSVYEQASKGNTVSHLGHTIFGQSFLGSRDHCGFLYLRPSFQCLHKLTLPSPPYIVGILLQKWETPWAKVFPIRLLLRLGAEYRYYPCPLISVRFRKPVFGEIGHTIMNLLADFRHFQYMLPQIRGVRIHMQDKQTYICFPRNRYDDVMKVVSNANEHVMALGANFSTDADSHLVCIQNDDGNYHTQAINIQNKPRKITGASFVVFNGALKSSSGLRAKSSIVEDGLMVQITPDSMIALKAALRDMQDYTVACGSIEIPDPEEQVYIQWTDDDHDVNIGVSSPIDGMAMDGIESIHIHSATDYIGAQRAIRWTEVFFIHTEDGGNSRMEPVDLSRLAEMLASAFCLALTPHLDALKEAGLTKLALRCSIDRENVGYEVGSMGDKLPVFYMNDLDNELIPVIHNAASQSQDGPVVMELIFYVIE